MGKLMTTTRTTNLSSRKIHRNKQEMMMSSSSNRDSIDLIRHVGIDEMRMILSEFESDSTASSTGVVDDVTTDTTTTTTTTTTTRMNEYCVMDVRTDEEVIYTGKLSPSIHTIPVQIIMQYNVFALDQDDFEEVCGFPKPPYDTTLVFTCKAGIRSVYACQYAAQAGYSKLINYVGGSSEWFSTR